MKSDANFSVVTDTPNVVDADPTVNNRRTMEDNF